MLLAVLHFSYPLPYVYRVLAYQDSDFSDIFEFPARSITASASPSEFPVAPDPNVASVFEQHEAIDDFPTFLEQTGTSAFIVVRNDTLVEERYLMEHDRESLQNTFSVSKSITSMLVGLAVRDALVDLNDPITKFIPELAVRDDRFSEITLEHLLDMRSGIRYSKDVSFPFFTSDDPQIYYHPDLASVLLERTQIAEPPGQFQYNNYNPPLLGMILRRVTGISPSEYLQRELWEPLGAEYDAGWTTDDEGFERMESGFHASGRDIARLGLLYLHDGIADGTQILPKAWIDSTTMDAEPWVPDLYDGRSWGYRAGWWTIPRPDGSWDYCGIGRYGQFLYVSPRYNIVIVRTGPGRGEWGDRSWTALFYAAAERL